MSDDELPFIDEHAVDLPVPRAEAWTVLRRYIGATLGRSERHPLGRVLGTVPRAGFAIAEEVEAQRIVLAGRHRFSRYRLVFVLDDAPDGGTRLRARTSAVFPGPHGAVYRALVIGTRGHVLATRYVLRSVQRLATAPA